MAKIFTAPFAQTPKTATAVTTAACASFADDTPTETALLFKAGTEGALLTRLTAIPRATVTASSLLLFLSKDDGTTFRLIDSELMSAHTVAATTAIPETTFSNYSETTPLRLMAGDSLYVGNQVALAGGVVFKAEYMEY
ncbi:MAG: hypothetical protein PHI31_09790 [Desulfuromonadaceae bacterium]|nr:hypothetical protein [Desulfuromonadaceae bacterium]